MAHKYDTVNVAKRHQKNTRVCIFLVNRYQNALATAAPQGAQWPAPSPAPPRVRHSLLTRQYLVRVTPGAGSRVTPPPRSRHRGGGPWRGGGTSVYTGGGAEARPGPPEVSWSAGGRPASPGGIVGRTGSEATAELASRPLASHRVTLVDQPQTYSTEITSLPRTSSIILFLCL